MIRIKTILSSFFCFLYSFAFSQQDNLPKSTVEAYKRINEHNKLFSPEKIHLQLDKPHYVLGDTIWFKAYVLDGAFLGPTSKSGILYVELSNDSTNTAVRKMVSLKLGLGDGYFLLPEKGNSGNYTLRAYTNWMRNFDEAFIFKKHFSVSSPTPDSWLIRTIFTRSKDGGKEKENVRLLFSTPDGKPVPLREMQLKLTDGKHSWYQNAMQTDVDGAVNFNFILPDAVKTNNLSLQIQDLRKKQGNRKLNVPLLLSRSENADLQFMPEGGTLVVGCPSLVAFKAIDKAGKGVSVKGGVYNSRNEEITSFQSAYRGMGAFYFLPQTNEKYIAQVELPGGQTSIYPLPEAKSMGVVMQVKNAAQDDSVQVKIIPSTDSLPALPHYLIGQARGVVCFAVKLSPSGGLYKIAKSDLPTGITRLTILDRKFEPMNERSIFINQQDQLLISIQTNKKNYTTRDSVALLLTVTDKNGKPVRGSFSMSVTDDAQVRSDSLSERSILASMLLCSEIKGNVEDPSFYFRNNNPDAYAALDLLMLSQGWVSYDWQAIFKTQKPKFPAEPGFSISGKVTNLFNKGIPNAKITLYSKRPAQFMDTLTDAKGHFTFRNLYPLDTASYFIQSQKLNGSSTGGILLDEFEPPSFPVEAFSLKPWYVNSDTATINTIKNKTIIKKLQDEILGIKTGILLKEVVIKAKRVIPGSKNLNGPGESDQVFDKDAMARAGKMGLLEFLEKNLEGFTVGQFPNKEGTPCRPIPFTKRKTAYVVYNNGLKVTIDGVDIDLLFAPAGRLETLTEHYEHMRSLLGHYTVEDIKGIELMRSRKFAGTYEQNQLSLEEKGGKCGDYTFLEITTYSAKGPFLKNLPGVYLYRPIAFSSPKQFYSPRYPVKNEFAPPTDLRATLHWEPNIITDTAGKATVSFYTSDNTGSYNIYCEGTDLNGGVGLGTAKITVRPEQKKISGNGSK